MKKIDFKTKTVDELKSDLLVYKKELFNLQFRKAMTNDQKPSRIKIVKRSIARILTFIRQKGEK